MRTRKAHSHLVCATDEVEVVLGKEFTYNVRAKGEGHAPVVLGPPDSFLIRVSPQQVAQKPLVGNVCGTHNAPNLFRGLKVRRES